MTGYITSGHLAVCCIYNAINGKPRDIPLPETDPRLCFIQIRQRQEPSFRIHFLKVYVAFIPLFPGLSVIK